jgi:MoxR-like ATPase
MKTDVRGRCEILIKELEKAIVGKRIVLEKVVLGLLSNGHILIEDFPGLAKTLMAKSFSKCLGLDFKRVQFTPDLLPADITGTYVLDRKTGEFILRKGPIFTNILLADEINRSPPKTQAALLEAMQERQTTLEGETMHLPKPFVVFATQNPIEYEGTYPLPEAQVDRFLMRVDIGYPSRNDEIEILRRRDSRKKEEVDLERMMSPDDLIDLHRAVEAVHIDSDVQAYMVEIVRRTRQDNQVEVGSSPRGSLALLALSKATAALNGRDYVLPDDVKFSAVEAIAHRLILKPDPWVRGVKTQSIISRILKDVPVPKTER